MLGEVRGLCDPDNLRAEFAIQVAGGQQGQGLGRMLLEKLIRYLRSRGTALLVGECLDDNQRLKALAQHLGFEVSASGEGAVLSLRLNLQV